MTTFLEILFGSILAAAGLLFTLILLPANDDEDR